MNMCDLRWLNIWQNLSGILWLHQIWILCVHACLCVCVCMFHWFGWNWIIVGAYAQVFFLSNSHYDPPVWKWSVIMEMGSPSFLSNPGFGLDAVIEWMTDAGYLQWHVLPTAWMPNTIGKEALLDMLPRKQGQFTRTAF